MKNLRSRFERFCFRNRTKGIPNLMLYVSLGSLLVYIMSIFDRTGTLYYFLCFDKNLILHGQVWRLFTYALTYNAGNILLTVIGLLCFYSLGRAMENIWGTFRFNLFYFSGLVLMDIYCMIFNVRASVSQLNLSLLLSYATLYPDAQFLLFFIIPVKAWVLAVFDLALVVLDLFLYPFPFNLFSLVALLNYFLFFGKDILNVIPMSWQVNARRLFHKSPKPKAPRDSGPIPFRNAGSYQADHATPVKPYTHKCTVCGRTDVTNPELEFRYCSKCNGYYCYCEDHINNHEHIK